MSGQDDDQDPVTARIARILDAKRRDNAEVVSALKVAEDAWERLSKEVDTAIGEEFDLVNAEQEAVLAAKQRLLEPEVTPSDESFVIAGRVFEGDSATGLPQILVRIVRERSDAPELIAEVLTDAGGAFSATATVTGPTAAGPTAAPPTALRVEALTTADARPVAVVRRDVRLVAGGIERFDIPVARTRGIADRVTAGEAAGESLDETIAAVELRLTSMRAAHTATMRFSDLTRDGLRDLSEALGVDPPSAPASVGVDGIEPVDGLEPIGDLEPFGPPQSLDGPPTSRGGGEAEPPQPAPSARSTSTSLEAVRGIGPTRAQQLRDAGIPDVEAFVLTPIEQLEKILGATAQETLVAAQAALAQRRGAAGEDS